MDISVVGGLLFAVAVIVFVGIGPANIMLFVDVPSLGIVIGGTLGAIFVAYPTAQVTSLVAILKNVFMPQVNDPIATIKLIVNFAEQARREGILALESRIEEVPDEFLKKGIQLAVDGTEPSLIKDIMNTEVSFIEERHGSNASMMGDIAGLCPAFGMVGTLVGLVLMLANMADPSAIGPAMAVALITTLYGAIVANLFFTPFQMKLKSCSAKEIVLKTMMLEGIMSLQAGDNPKIVEWKLSSFVDPATRILISEQKDG